MPRSAVVRLADRRTTPRSRLVRASVLIGEAAFVVAGAAEGIADPDGLAGLNHGKAA